MAKRLTKKRMEELQNEGDILGLNKRYEPSKEEFENEMKRMYPNWKEIQKRNKRK